MNLESEVTNSLTDFLDAWKAKDMQVMLEHCQLTWATRTNNKLEWLAALVEAVPITKYRIISIEKVSEVFVRATAEINGNKRTTICLVKESVPYKTSKTGQWGINPISALRFE